jgi:hypothetical protein
MANRIKIILTITGGDLEDIQREIEERLVETEWGATLALGDSVIGIDAKCGDGVSVEPECITIRAESIGYTMLGFVDTLSREYPHLTFLLETNDITNDVFVAWRFRNGDGALRDCVAGRHGEEEEIVYALSGLKLRDLPAWMPFVGTPVND